MRYAVIVDPALLEQIDLVDPPQAVRDSIVEQLAELETNPQEGLYDHWTGHRKVVEVWHEGHLHRFAFAVEIHDNPGVVWVTAVAINPP